MPRIEVCLGSSCFLKGAYQVLDTLLALRQEHGLEREVAIAGAFCKEECRRGVAVEVDGRVYSVPDTAAARALFAELFVGGPETRDESDHHQSGEL